MAFSTDRANTIGFIGLGAMGNHMVHYRGPHSMLVLYLTLTLAIAEQPDLKIQAAGWWI